MIEMDLSDIFSFRSGTDKRNRTGATRDYANEALRVDLTLARYLNPNNFQIADEVTPLEGYGLAGVGERYVVIELNPSAKPSFGAGDTTTSNFGFRPEMRVIRAVGPSGATILAFWVERWQFGYWTQQPADQPADAFDAAATPNETPIADIKPAAEQSGEATTDTRPSPWAGSTAPETGEPERTEGAAS